MNAKYRLLTLLLVLASVAVLAGVAQACNPGRANNGHQYQDGWLTGPGKGEQCSSGSQADITIRDPYILIGSAAWTMIYYGTTGHFAQVGYAKTTGHSDRNFLEYKTATLTDTLKWPTNVPAPTVGASTNYKVDFGNSFHFFIGNTIVFTSPSTGYLGCDNAQAGETDTLADQMPGVSGTREQFANSFIYTGHWTEALFWSPYIEDLTTGGSASAYFGNSTANNLEDDIWDKCS